MSHGALAREQLAKTGWPEEDAGRLPEGLDSAGESSTTRLSTFPAPLSQRGTVRSRASFLRVRSGGKAESRGTWRTPAGVGRRGGRLYAEPLARCSEHGRQRLGPTGSTEGLHPTSGQSPSHHLSKSRVVTRVPSNFRGGTHGPCFNKLGLKPSGLC